MGGLNCLDIWSDMMATGPYSVAVGTKKRGEKQRLPNQPVSFSDMPKYDTGLESTDELKTVMLDIKEWTKRIILGRV